MYAEGRRWKCEIANINETELGGIKEISFIIEGDGAYSAFKFESGVHRVRAFRNGGGRAYPYLHRYRGVLPEMEEVDFEINPLICN